MMSGSLRPLSSDVRHFCRQMLLAMETQMDGGKSKIRRDRQGNSDRYLELLKDLCDVFAKGFDMTRCDVLERLGNFANPSETIFNEFCRFPTTPPHESSLPVTNPTQVVDAGIRPNVLLTVPTPRGRCTSNNQVRERRDFLYSEYRENFSAPYQQRKSQRFHLDETCDSRPRSPSMIDQVEEFFIQRFSGASKPAAVCTKVLKTVGRSIALRRLGSVLEVLRNERSLLRLDMSASSAQIWRCLKLSESLTTAGVYFRRLYLVQLVDRHKMLLEDCKRSDSQPDADCSDRAASQALDLLTKQIFPSDQHRGSARDEQNRKKVQNCLCAGRKWDRFVSTHFLVIVLLVATGSKLGLNSQDIEHLHDDHVDGLLNGLQQFREPMLAKMCERLEKYVMDVAQGEPPIWRMKFEVLDWDVVNGENMTDEELLELCEPDYASPEEAEGPSELQ